MIKDAIAKLDEYDKRMAKGEDIVVGTDFFREILIALGKDDDLHDTFKRIGKDVKDIELRVGELEKKQMAVSQSVGGDSFKFLSDKEEDIYTEKDGTPIVHDEGNGVDNDGNIIQYKVHGGKSEVKEEEPLVDLSCLDDLAYKVMNEEKPSIHDVTLDDVILECQKREDTIQIPRAEYETLKEKAWKYDELSK